VQVVLAGKHLHGPVANQGFEDIRELAGQAGIIRFRILLPGFRQPPLHRGAHVALGDALVADADQGAAAAAEPKAAGARGLHVLQGKAGKDADQEHDSDNRADRRFGHLAEKGSHVERARALKKCRRRFRGGGQGRQAREGTADGVEKAGGG
jgi:hypothetical protein